jgi:hypothetical protein
VAAQANITTVAGPSHHKIGERYAPWTRSGRDRSHPGSLPFGIVLLGLGSVLLVDYGDAVALGLPLGLGVGGALHGVFDPRPNVDAVAGTLPVSTTR